MRNVLLEELVATWKRNADASSELIDTANDKDNALKAGRIEGIRSCALELSQLIGIFKDKEK